MPAALAEQAYDPAAVCAAGHRASLIMSLSAAAAAMPPRHG
ncbi:hypothetical protein E6C60_1404 [Paenibacillus algicola]|uniref:Uncharacterized protein n=1 Tax=Paenibacillus algicola TaxID=2565926 RepID=A0A4P8XKJ2_9BACL|nr:hypothetical protein E6C60_1404 [Paenibacillus algicola]